MAPTPTPPPPPPSRSSSSSAPPFKTPNTSSPAPNTAPPQGAPPTSPAAATPPPPFSMVVGVSEAVLSVFDVSTTLRAQGYLAGQEIPSITLPEERAPQVFDSLLASFLAQSHGPGLLPPRPMPPLLGDGSAVGLLRLYLAVKSFGGFDAVPCWAAVAEAAGLDPSMDAPIKIVYYKYLCPLEQSFQKARMLRQEAARNRRLSAATKGKFLAPAARDDAEADGGGEEELDLKRKREKVVGMLNWVRLVAKKPDRRRSGRSAADNHLAMALMFRRQMFKDEGCSDKPHGCASPESGLTTENGWDDQQSAGGSSNWNYRANRSFGLADIPEWTGKPSVPYEDPDMLRFLGEPILTPESNEAFDDTIGKGRPDKCNCEFPGSTSCVRFHVTEAKTELKHRLGSSYYAMKFDQTGEDAALTWTKDEEEKFETIIQENLPSSKYKFWDKLRAAFRYKGESALVSYYYNVFQPRRRAFQNRVARHVNGVDSDDDSIEPAFLHLRQGGGKSSSRSSASSGNGNRS
uniref:ARID domain-containing protein n=1 Tax=Leersia perrieri TaxID=77586 RepID=A0A0D9XK52_9ORYZ